jgi:hypothetical protein
MPKININMQWLIPLATVAWGVWTWASDRERERDRERTRIAALYVNPFLSACEDLQSRIYSILEFGGLPSLRKRYPDGSYAEETLYLIIRYFGWAVAVERHGHYTRDPVFMQLGSAVRHAFSVSSSEQQVGPFNFFQPEQKALGKLVMTTKEGQYGAEPETISYYDFKRLLASPPLCESASLNETLEVLRTADHAENLSGGYRLAEVQNHLVDLLNYVERKEGFTLFHGERGKCRRPTSLRTAAGCKPLSTLSARPSLRATVSLESTARPTRNT